MECERSNIFVLVVDNDDVSLDILANILIAWQYRVITAKNALDAMQHLRDFDGVFDLIITEVHLPGISGIAFQKHVKDDYQIPVIVMSNDRRESVICNSYEYGAAHYIMKPFCAEDFKDIWKIAMDAKKEKLFIENELIIYDQERESFGGDDDVNSLNTLNDAKIKKKYCKRKNDEYQDGDFQVLKKPKLVWTTYLHNLFLLAIKQIGLDKAVPKKILEVMNIPNLTRENVASHLQKYRIFLRDVAEKGMIGGISHRALRSRFASSLPVSVIKEIQAIRTNKLRAPTLQYLQKLSYQNGDDNNVLQQFNQVSSNNNDQFSFLQKGLTLQELDQVRIGKSSLENNVAIQQNKFGISSSSIPTFHQAKNSYNDGANGFHGLMNSSSSFLTRGLNNYGNQNYGLRNLNMTSLNNNSNNVLFQKNNIFIPMSNNPFGVQLNNGFGFNVGANNENVNVGGSFGLVQGGFGLNSVSDVSGGSGSGSGSEVPTTFVNAENVAEVNQFVENVNQNNGAANLISENEFKQMEINVADFLMADDNLNLLNEMDVNRVDASGLSNADFNFFQDEQPFEQLRGNEGCFNRFMGDKASSAPTSTIGTQELDVDLIEALFGAKEN